MEKRIRSLHVSKLVKKRIDSPMEIMDVGSGNGNYAFYLGKSFPEARIIGVDISKENMDTASLIINVSRCVFGK